MTNPTISSRGAYKPRKNRSKNDPTYENDLLEEISLFFYCANVRKDITLKNRTNRDENRTTHKNLVIMNTNIVELMSDFILKKYPLETYCVPRELQFFRNCYDKNAGKNTFSTLYNSFKKLNTKKFKSDFPNINYISISQTLYNLTGYSVASKTIEDNYNIIIEFLKTF